MKQSSNPFIKILILAFFILQLLVIPLCLVAEDKTTAVKGVQTTATSNTDKYMLAITATVSVGISCAMSAYALAKIGSAALGAMSEKPEIGGRALIFLGMAEGIAIYGLIVAIMILNKI